MYDMYPEWGSSGPDEDPADGRAVEDPMDRHERSAPQPDERADPRRS
jgi:hypothetical protein